MKTIIENIKGSWTEVLNDCRWTVNKGPLNKEPSDDFKREILIGEHSPIRGISIKWRWEDVKNWVITHWVRHKWEKYVPTQRSDLTGTNRDDTPQGMIHKMKGEANVQNLIDTFRKRLCYRASKETRECAEDFKNTLREHDSFIADVLVPNCIYRGGCPEGSRSKCKFFKEFTDRNGVFTDIQARYDAYNKEFYDRF